LSASTAFKLSAVQDGRIKTLQWKDEYFLTGLRHVYRSFGWMYFAARYFALNTSSANYVRLLLVHSGFSNSLAFIKLKEKISPRKSQHKYKLK
jgi:hypothetical protein